MGEAEIADLARLHAACLTDSLVTEMGPGYVRAFYRYVVDSPREFVVTSRDAAGRIVAATVISLEPATFNRRLLLHTPLLPHLIVRLPALVGGWWRPTLPVDAGAISPLPKVPDTMPEMLLIFVAAEQRGAGRGRALVHEVDGDLRARGVPAYQARTELNLANRALRFYDENGFTRAGVSVRLGKPFQVFVRTLPNA